ncbi:MAG: hypothetical protein WDN66_04600 [Candidatus Saccharibacteria bacterium]
MTKILWTSTTITAPTIVNNGSILSTTGTLQFVGVGTGNPIAITMGNSSATINAQNNSLSFNTSGTPGQLTITGGVGTIKANNSVFLNGSSTTAVNVNVGSITTTVGTLHFQGNALTLRSLEHWPAFPPVVQLAV